MTPDQKFYFANAALQIACSPGLGYSPTEFHLDEIRDRYPELRWLVDGYQAQEHALEEMVGADELTASEEEVEQLNDRITDTCEQVQAAQNILHNLLVEEEVIDACITALYSQQLDKTALKVHLETLKLDLEEAKAKLEAIEDE